MEKELVEKINRLYHKSQTEGLTPEELEEQKAARAEYLRQFRTSFKKQLDQIEIVD